MHAYIYICIRGVSSWRDSFQAWCIWPSGRPYKHCEELLQAADRVFARVCRRVFNIPAMRVIRRWFKGTASPWWSWWTLSFLLGLPGTVLVGAGWMINQRPSFYEPVNVFLLKDVFQAVMRNKTNYCWWTKSCITHYRKNTIIPIV